MVVQAVTETFSSYLGPILWMHQHCKVGQDRAQSLSSMTVQTSFYASYNLKAQNDDPNESLPSQYEKMLRNKKLHIVNKATHC